MNVLDCEFNRLPICELFKKKPQPVYEHDHVPRLEALYARTIDAPDVLFWVGYTVPGMLH
jgi:hypothetical protein